MNTIISERRMRGGNKYDQNDYIDIKFHNEMIILFK